MKFMNSNYGYANFGVSREQKQARKMAAKNAQKLASQNKTAPKSGGFKSLASTEDVIKGAAYGPQPLVGPQQKKGGFGNAMDSARGKGQYYGAKAKNTLAKAGRFIGKNKVGVGLAAAGALGAGIGATALMRKMRSDKGKKRGQYSK